MPGRGLRRVDYATVARAGGGGTWGVNARMVGIEGEVSLGTGIAVDPQGGLARRVQVNGAAARTAESMLEHVRVLWLTPAQDGLFTGPAADRRRFLDRMVLATDPAHGRRVAEYEKVMRGRNRLLEEGMMNESWLSAQERQLAELGTAIALARRELVDVLTHLIADSSDPASPFPDAALELDGVLGAQREVRRERRHGGRGARAARPLAGRATARRGARRKDRTAPTSRCATRPKDIEAALCSTGEQKALLVGLVLAHARLVGELTTATPILLLDEIAAHLDAGRRAALFDRVDDLAAQAWMTGTDASLFEALGERAQHLTVADGAVRTTR